MSPIILEKRYLTSESQDEFFYRQRLFLWKLTKIEIRGTNSFIKIRVFVFLICMIFMGIFLHIFSPSAAYITPIMTFLSANICVWLVHQFILTRRRQYMTLSIFRSTSPTYFLIPSFALFSERLYCLINAENLTHLDIDYLIKHSVRFCYPG